MISWFWTDVIYISIVGIGSGVWMENLFILFLKSGYSCTLFVTSWLAGLWTDVIYKSTTSTSSGIWMDIFLYLFLKSGYSCTMLVTSWLARLELMWFTYRLPVQTVVYRWKLFIFYFSSLVIVAPCLLVVDQLVLNWCDFHIHYQYREWSMDEIFFLFISQVWL
jgi:hypothetical protein